MKRCKLCGSKRTVFISMDETGEKVVVKHYKCLSCEQYFKEKVNK